MIDWQRVAHADVLRAIKDYDQLGPERFFSPSMVSPLPRLMSWPGKDAVTRRKRSWAQLMSPPQAGAWLRLTSRAGTSTRQ